MSILTTVVLMVVTLPAAYMLWSLLLRAEHLYTRLEGHGQTAADIAGAAFLGLTAVIVVGALAALRSEVRVSPLSLAPSCWRALRRLAAVPSRRPPRAAGTSHARV
jgi:hypothetical protein